MNFQALLQNWLAAITQFLPKLLSGLVIFIITIIGSGFIAKWIRKLVSKKVSDPEMLQLIFLITRWTMLIVGTVLALDQVDFNVTGFIAGLGVAGFTIGFALQDIAKNFISGLLLLYRQAFNIGEFVKVSDHTGMVREINVRDTVIETVGGEMIIIPNQEVFENAIINYSQSKQRRRTVSIGLGYEEDTAKALEIFLEAINNVPGVSKDPGPKIRACELGDSALQLNASFWVNQADFDMLDVHSKVVNAIKRAAEINDINLPYPMQKILISHLNK